MWEVIINQTVTELYRDVLNVLGVHCVLILLWRKLLVKEPKHPIRTRDVLHFLDAYCCLSESLQRSSSGEYDSLEHP